MASKFWPKGGLPGILHHYTETLTTFEYTAGGVSKPHSFLFVGGLGDGLATTEYMADVVRALEPTPWSLFTLNLSSAYNQWGLGHLDRDTDEVAECLRYIQDYKKSEFDDSKIVLMGHSTGSQVVLHYLYKPNPHTSTPAWDPNLEHVKRPVLDGAIMQAPVSDRHAIQLVMEEGWLGKTPAEVQAVYRQLEAMAKDALRRKEPLDLIAPLALTSQIGYGTVPLSFRRLSSLVSFSSPQKPGEDDLFSSDLSDEQLAETFGNVQSQGLLRDRLVVLYSGADQSVPDFVNKEYLMRRWRISANRGGKVQVWDDEFSGVIPGASHALSNDDQAEPRKDLVRRVSGYLNRILEQD
ncbi:hypothetical protein BJ878DRAFT_495105 [Calycina marina]|uniref:DUF1749-domain-containing protein n=1 Tax=Calycina marina TaxID=1763456 RepID=A0A9P8CHI3_9HELO|nr:hypothetical protein BJ878DRAFT_495105 [Calycina marina]